MIKFNESRLPEQAREKLLALDARRVEEAAASIARLPYEVTDAKISERVRVSQDRHRLRHDKLHALCTHVRQWLASLPPNAVLEPAEPVTAKLRQNETLAQAIERLRDEIAAAENNLRVVKAAPLLKSELKAAASLLVQQLAQRGRPKVSAGRDGLKVAFTADPRADTFAHRDDIAALLCWQNQAAMVSAIEREIDALSETQPAMSAAEQSKRASELAGQLLELERQEEALIDKAASEGVDIPRRENASPVAVLGITVVAKVKALEAA
jgi:hypothetical protein